MLACFSGKKLFVELVKTGFLKDQKKIFKIVRKRVLVLVLVLDVGVVAVVAVVLVVVFIFEFKKKAFEKFLVFEKVECHDSFQNLKTIPEQFFGIDNDKDAAADDNDKDDDDDDDDDVGDDENCRCRDFFYGLTNNVLEFFFSK